MNILVANKLAGKSVLPLRAFNNPAHPLSGLMLLPQWVVWKSEQFPDEPKPRKVPYSPVTGQRASSTDPGTWGTFTQAQAVMGQYTGIGVMFTPLDPYGFGDLDGCRNPETGEWSAEAIEIASRFSGAAMEVSQSRTGMHIVGRVAAKTAFADRRRKWAGWLEFYVEARFMALGSLDGWQGDAETDITAAALAWVPRVAGDGAAVTITGDRDARWCGPEDDAELIRRMLDYETVASQVSALDRALTTNPHDLNAVAAMARAEPRLDRKRRLQALWSGDAAILGQYFPSETGGEFDHSAADLALMNEIAFFSGNDAERMLRIFSKSALAKRDKWQNRKDYQQFTLKRALGTQRDVYRGNREEQREKVKRENEAIAAESEYKIHADILSLADMLERLFFIASGSGGGGVADLKSGTAMSVAIARNYFAASTEQIEVIDGRSGKPKMKQVSSFDLWMKEPGRHHANNLTWTAGGAPICDVPGHPYAVGFNTWRGIPGVRFLDHMRQDAALREGWLIAWHQHLAYLFPVESERRQFEQWCAHIIQHPEELPQTGWCLIATQTGIGRNWLGSVLHRVIRGHVLGNAVLDGVLTGNFNGLMSRKLLIVVDEAKAGMRGASAWQNAEKLKTLVNPEFRSIDEKHGLQTVESNHMRWLVFSQHFDALPVETNDRRWNFVENPTVRQSPEYYRWLYDTLRRPEFIASVRAHLEALDLSGFHYGDVSISNPTRDRVLRELATDLDLHIAEFRDTWPAPVARGMDLVNCIGRMMPGKNYPAKMLYKLAAKAGMTVTDRLGRAMTPFVITGGGLTEADIAANPAHWLTIATEAAGQFAFPNSHPG